MRENITRRRFALGVGTVATGTLGSIALGSQNATATVDGQFSIPNGQTVLADTSLQDVRLSVETSWEYSANAPIHGIELELHVGQTFDSLDLIARQTKSDLAESSLTGTSTLNGSLMSASDFSVSDFEPSSGELTRSVAAELRFYAIRDNEVVAEAVQQETFDVTVSDEALTVEMSMNSTGSIEFQTS